MNSVSSIPIRFSPVCLAALAAFALAACGPRNDHDHPQTEITAHEHGHAQAVEPAPAESPQGPLVAVAHMNPTEGHDVRGTVTFTRVEGGIRVVAELTGFDAPGLRGFHIHEFGDCSAPDATSAGGHFDPFGHDHAGPDDDERHVGDLGNIEVDAGGNASYDRIDPLLAFEGEASIIGKSVVVHAEEDDLETQPTGDAGGRVACGVIEVVE